MLDRRRSSSLTGRKTTLARLDDALLVVAIAIGAIIAFQTLGWLFGALWFVAKLVIAGLIVGFVASLVLRRTRGR